MFAKIFSAATAGLDPVLITVEVDISEKGLPSFTIVGLPDKAVEESRERVRSAIKNSGADFPARRITVNLAPADLPKEGPAYDLPIAVGILIASGQLENKFEQSLLVGELSLDGTLRHTNGILPIAWLAKNLNHRQIYLPFINTKEAAIIKGVKIFGVVNLMSLFLHVQEKEIIKPTAHIPYSTTNKYPRYEFDFADVKGQEHVKRALEIVACGFHNIHLKGTPGAGKTMLARAVPGILPPLSEEEALEVTKIYSITGNLPPQTSIIYSRPFRAPHHTTSRIGLIGGGSKPMPGEISLAHRGVLFLDEFPEFPRHVLEALRQPMEDGIVTISRAAGSLTFPSKFILIAASNPCPCGFYLDPNRRCKCLPGQIDRYQKKISGPLTDRIDLHLDVSAVKVEELTKDQKDLTDNVQTSKTIRQRVIIARLIQKKRFKQDKIFSNGEMNVSQIKKHCKLSSDAKNLLNQAVDTLHLTARAYFRMIKVAQTIADIANEDEIKLNSIAEALQYRPKEGVI